MEMMELAHQLGELIKESKEMQRMNEAEAAYDADETLQKLIQEYNTHDTALGENSDSAIADAITKRMNEIYDEVTKNPVYIEYLAAQQAVHALMNEVNGEIQFAITGQRPCSGEGCDHCSGCSH